MKKEFNGLLARVAKMEKKIKQLSCCHPIHERIVVSVYDVYMIIYKETCKSCGYTLQKYYNPIEATNRGAEIKEEQAKLLREKAKIYKKTEEAE